MRLVLLSIAFIFIFGVLAALKLFGIITWSWWWVAAPIWCFYSLFVGMIGLHYLTYKYLSSDTDDC